MCLSLITIWRVFWHKPSVVQMMPECNKNYIFCANRFQWIEHDLYNNKYAERHSIDVIQSGVECNFRCAKNVMHTSVLINWLWIICKCTRMCGTRRHTIIKFLLPYFFFHPFSMSADRYTLPQRHMHRAEIIYFRFRLNANHLANRDGFSSSSIFFCYFQRTKIV